MATAVGKALVKEGLTILRVQVGVLSPTPSRPFGGEREGDLGHRRSTGLTAGLLGGVTGGL